MENDTNTEIINNYRNYDSRQVIAAIDARLREEPIEYGTALYDQLQKIKWSDAYSHAIDDPDQALHDNAGFYVDAILWMGYAKVQEMKCNKPDKGLTHA